MVVARADGGAPASTLNGQTAIAHWMLTVADLKHGGDVGTINGWRVFGCILP